MAKTFLADRQRQWIKDLADNGELSAPYRDTATMDELLTVSEALKHPIASYFLLKYIRKTNKQPSAYFAVGDIITAPHAEFGDIPHVVIGKDRDGAGTITLLTLDILTLKAFDAKEATHADANVKLYGYNRWNKSNLRQWLNSGQIKNKWFAAQTTTDTPPNSTNQSLAGAAYEDQPGYLNGFDIDFVGYLKTTTKRTGLNTITDGGGYEDNVEKVFCLSNTEVGLAMENGVDEGAAYPYFSSNASRIANPSEYMQAQFNATGYTHQVLADNSRWAGWIWWLRTPNSASSYGVRYVYDSGVLYGTSANGGNIGVRPAIVI